MITYIIIIFFYIAPIILAVKTMSGYMAWLLVGVYIINTVFAVYYTIWWDQLGSTTPKLSYRAFIKLYNVMPDDFTLRKYDFYYKNTLIDFKTFPDWWRYRHLYKNIEKHKVEQEQLQRQAALISELQHGLTQQQNEIDKFVKEHVNEISNGN